MWWWLVALVGGGGRWVDFGMCLGGGQGMGGLGAVGSTIVEG